MKLEYDVDITNTNFTVQNLFKTSNEKFQIQPLKHIWKMNQNIPFKISTYNFGNMPWKEAHLKSYTHTLKCILSIQKVQYKKTSYTIQHS